MLFSKSKKILAMSGLAFSMSTNSSADTRNLQDYLNFDTDVRVAANALALEIREDHNGNHVPIPGHKAYEKLNIVSVDPNYTGTFEVDENTNLVKKLEISTISFQAVGVPLFSEYAATVKLVAFFTPDCTAILPGSRSYEVVKSNSSLVDSLFKKDLTGRSYNAKYYAYADVVFESVLTTNEKLHALCPNFVPHDHKERL